LEQAALYGKEGKMYYALCMNKGGMKLRNPRRTTESLLIQTTK